MKTLFFTIAILMATTTFAQLYCSSNAKIESITKKSLYSTGRIAVHTPKRDTLYVSNDEIGDTLRLMWELYPSKEKTPVIISLSDEQLMKMFVLIYDSKVDKSKNEISNSANPAK